MIKPIKYTFSVCYFQLATRIILTTEVVDYSGANVDELLPSTLHKCVDYGSYVLNDWFSIPTANNLRHAKIHGVTCW